MRPKKQFAAVLGSRVLALSLPVMAQSTSQSNTTATQDPPLATSQNAATTTTTQDSSVPATVAPPVTQDAAVPAAMAQDTDASDNNAPMTKRDLKDQKKEQKYDEKSARENAKAQKDNTKALKHQDKSTDAAEKANSPQQSVRHEAGDGAARLGALFVPRRTVFSDIAMGAQGCDADDWI